ncbi:MAG TPA: HEAT repeat domain-containing protein [Pyrinomonadaceae bacterium]|nr:HEAT repeat domain-containing protein [Pyrinomonadaceae bacterium]
MLALLTFILFAFAPVSMPAQQEQGFTPVQGATLQARAEAAQAQATAARHARYWTAYSFDVRPGVAVDVDYVSDDGRFNIRGTWDAGDGGTYFVGDGVSVSNYPGLETRSLGVFALRDSAGRVERIDVFNLARRHEYAGHPVYWMGRAANEESLNFLRAVAVTQVLDRSHSPQNEAVWAISLHDDRRVPEVLMNVARAPTTDEHVRARAVRALGLPPVPEAVREYLAQLIRDERESRDVRRAAVAAYGRARDAQALALMQSLYNSNANRDLRGAALTQIARNEDRQAAAAFLIRVAQQDTDKEFRKTAVARLGEIAGEQAMAALRQTATSLDADTELQRQAVSAIARRPVSESVPLLINIARTHAKPEIRKHAFVLLGRTGDPAAVEFLKSVLTK